MDNKTKKITITIPIQLDERINEYREKVGVPKSTLLQMAVTQYLDSQKMLETLPDMFKEMKKIMEENKND